jgi:hypothetical protein
MNRSPKQAIAAALSILSIVGIGHASLERPLTLIPDEWVESCEECQVRVLVRRNCQSRVRSPRARSEWTDSLTAKLSFEIADLGGNQIGVAVLNPGEPLEENFLFVSESRPGASDTYRTLVFAQETRRPHGGSERFATLTLTLDPGLSQGVVRVVRRGGEPSETSIQCVSQ